MKKIIEIKSIDRVSPTKIEAVIVIDDTAEVVTTTVSDSVANYVTIDRCDAYLYALLYFAITQNYDFKSEIPISEELYYNLQNHFFDALCDEKMNMHKPQLDVPVISAASHNGHIVATGISCGIDSLYTIATHGDNVPKPFRITHLAFFDIGSHGNGSNTKARKLSEGRYKRCKAFAEEYGYTFCTVVSDIYQIIENRIGYSHISNHTYMTAFCVMLLQSGIDKYYYSAGHPYQDFRCQKKSINEDFDASYYDLLSSLTLSINGVHFYSSGGGVSRIDKTKYLSTYEPAYKYLNVCVNHIDNDCTCFKCIRTLLGIDATGNLDKFKAVFDLDLYRKNRTAYLQEMYIKGCWRGDTLLREIIPYFQEELTLTFRAKSILKYFLRRMHLL